MPQPQYTIKKDKDGNDIKDKDNNPVYAGTDICAGMFDFPDTLAPINIPKYLKDSKLEYIKWNKDKNIKNIYKPLCVRTRNFNKEFPKLSENNKCQRRIRCTEYDKSEKTAEKNFGCEQSKTNCENNCEGTWKPSF